MNKTSYCAHMRESAWARSTVCVVLAILPLLMASACTVLDPAAERVKPGNPVPWSQR